MRNHAITLAEAESRWLEPPDYPDPHPDAEQVCLLAGELERPVRALQAMAGKQVTFSHAARISVAMTIAEHAAAIESVADKFRDLHYNCTLNQANQLQQAAHFLDHVAARLLIGQPLDYTEDVLLEPIHDADESRQFEWVNSLCDELEREAEQRSREATLRE